MTETVSENARHGYKVRLEGGRRPNSCTTFTQVP
jgi:hypothetical protein